MDPVKDGNEGEEVFTTPFRYDTCPRCGSEVVEMRGFDPNDCGGCDTCEQYFGGVYVCGNAICQNRIVADRVLDPEQHSWSAILPPPTNRWTMLRDSDPTD